jgi:hypothetical protein
MTVFLGFAAETPEGHSWKASILQLSLNGQDPDLTLQLREAVVPLQAPPAGAEALARIYRAAASAALAVTPVMRSDRLWSLVAAGPLLDSPDSARVEATVLEDHRFHIEVVYTNARLRGAGFRRNLPWRPLLVLAVESRLPPGEYNAEVVWRLVEAIPDGKELAPPHKIGPVYFKVE